MSDDASQTSDDAPPPWKVNNQKLPTRKTENTKEFSKSSKRKRKKIRQGKIPLNKTKKRISRVCVPCRSSSLVQQPGRGACHGSPPPFYRVPHSPFFIPRQKGDNQFQTQQQTYQSTQPNTLPVFFCSIGYGKNSLAKSFKPINWPPPPPLPPYHSPKPKFSDPW